MPFTKFSEYFNTKTNQVGKTERKNSISEMPKQDMLKPDLESTIKNTGKEVIPKHNRRHITEETFHQSSDNLIVGL